MININEAVEELLSEVSHSSDNAYFRKVSNGNGDSLIRRFSLRLDHSKNRVELDLLISDIEDALEDCGYTEGKRKDERLGNYMAAGAVGGALTGAMGSKHHRHVDSNVALGSLIGMGVGALAAHMIEDDNKKIIVDHVRKLQSLHEKAKNKMLRMK